MTERPVKPPLAKILDQVLDRAMQIESPSFRDLVRAAALNPARDFVGASLVEVDFRDEDLRGFDFSNADLTGADFRRANVQGVRFDGAILDGAIGLPLPLPSMRSGVEIFVSYSKLDDALPPDVVIEGGGFVSYLLTQVRYDLMQLGVPDAILWQDRGRIARGDDWNEEIVRALNRAEIFIVILSKNYVRSSVCMQELSAIASRLETLEGRGRIFRIDKHDVPENEIPEMLRRIQAVRFYREDLDAKNVQEFYWRGKVRLTDEYEGAVYYLTTAICKRLEELGIPLQPQVQRQPTVSLPPSNGRVVFVAKPAGDMVEAYRMLVRVLRDTGYRVTPEPDKELGELEDVRSAVVNGLAEAEASVHLLGKRTGGRPEGLDMDLAPLQLAAAEDEARRRPGFERMIWAPGVLPETSAEPEIVRRDPLEVLAGFGQRPLAMDQINSDTASRFNEFVLQRLERRDGDGEPRYDHVMMARALSQVTGRDVDEFLARMDWRVDPKTGNRVHQDAAGEWPRGSKTYPSFAYENREVARTYDTMMGTVVSVDLL